MRTWDLRCVRGLGVGRLLGRGQHPGAQHAHRGLLVLQLALLVLAADDDAGGDVRDPHGGVGGVDALPARAAGAVDVDAQVVGVDLHVDLLGLGQHQDARGRGVDPALGLGHRHPLDAVHAALELQPGVGGIAGLDGAASLDRDLDVLVAAEVGLLRVQDLGPPAAALGVAQVHPQQVGGEQRGLLAALAGLDLEDDVLVVHRVARHEQQGQSLGDALALGCRRVGLGGELRVLGGQLARGGLVLAELEPLAVGGDDGAQLGMALADPAGCRGIRVQRRIGHLLLEVGVLALEGEAVLEHG